MQNKLFWEVLPREQRKLLEIMANWPWLSAFYMAGGTALALQLGHRQSIDFDFFSHHEFPAGQIIRTLVKQGSFELMNQDQDTINGTLDKVKISFFKYPYIMLKDTLTHGNIRIAHMLDIALMKLEAIAGRGSKKDFVDLYFLLKVFTLPQLFEYYIAKYGAGTGNQYHLIKSLIYFKDAEQQPMPLLTHRVGWDKIKQDIVATVKRSLPKGKV